VKLRGHCRALLLPLLLAACAGAPPPSPVAVPAPVAAAPLHEGWAIDAGQSLITVVVRRGGPLARLGHDHVVASRAVTGFVDVNKGRAAFQFRLDEMSVDETALRKEAGLDTAPSADAIAGTRQNMLTKVLDAEHYPLVLMQAERAGDTVRLAVTLHGVTRTIAVPVQFDQGRDRIAASGSLRLKQSDFGIVPMSVLGGAMVVKDEMELAFRIVAHR
jgi:polyisoprenoid-binding protein YceI